MPSRLPGPRSWLTTTTCLWVPSLAAWRRRRRWANSRGLPNSWYPTLEALARLGPARAWPRWQAWQGARQAVLHRSLSRACIGPASGGVPQLPCLPRTPPPLHPPAGPAAVHSHAGRAGTLPRNGRRRRAAGALLAGALGLTLLAGSCCVRCCGCCCGVTSRFMPPPLRHTPNLTSLNYRQWLPTCRRCQRRCCTCRLVDGAHVVCSGMQHTGMGCSAGALQGDTGTALSLQCRCLHSLVVVLTLELAPPFPTVLPAHCPTLPR